MPGMPDLDRLREELSDCGDGDCLTCDTARFLLSVVESGGRLVVEKDCPNPPACDKGGVHRYVAVDDVAVVLDAARFLLSLAESGGRLVVEQPCEHGDDWITCDTEDCPGGSRTVVWPTDKETA